MPEVTRADKPDKLRRLAQDGMRWLQWVPWIESGEWSPMPEEPCFSINVAGELGVRREAKLPEWWDPFTDWRAAGELLVAMKTHHSSSVPSLNLDTWGRFCQRLISYIPERTGPAILSEHGGLNSYSNFPMPRDVITALAVIGPALIAQAAFEALEASHDKP